MTTSAIVLAIALTAVVSPEAVGPGEVVAEAGRTEVVVDTGAGSVTRYAAGELALHLGKSLGAEIPIRTVPTDGMVSLIVGTNEWSRAAGVFPETLPRDGYLIRSAPGRVYIAGCDCNRPWAMSDLLRATSMWKRVSTQTEIILQ